MNGSAKLRVLPLSYLDELELLLLLELLELELLVLDVLLLLLLRLLLSLWCLRLLLLLLDEEATLLRGERDLLPTGDLNKTTTI